jgi:hypothetical protein
MHNNNILTIYYVSLIIKILKYKYLYLKKFCSQLSLKFDCLIYQLNTVFQLQIKLNLNQLL